MRPCDHTPLDVDWELVEKLDPSRRSQGVALIEIACGQGSCKVPIRVSHGPTRTTTKYENGRDLGQGETGRGAGETELLWRAVKPAYECGPDAVTHNEW